MAKAGEVPTFVKETKKDILDVLRNTKEALDRRNSQELIETSNHLVHSVSIHNDPRAVYVSIIAYALGKIVEKSEALGGYRKELEEFLEGNEQNIEAAIKFLEKDELKSFDNAIKNILALISEFDNSFSKYVQDVLEFAKIQKGAKVYEHGLSVASVAKLVGISQWEMMEKIGETKAYDHGVLKTKSTRERYEQTKKALKKRD